MENFDVNALKTLKNTLDNLDMETQELEKKNNEINDEIDMGDINTEELINDNKSLQILQDINKDFSDTLNFLDEKINGMKDKIENKQKILIILKKMIRVIIFLLFLKKLKLI